MPPIPTRWLVPTPAEVADTKAKLDWLNPVIAQVLYKRGLVSEDDIEEFMGNRTRPDNPFRMKGVPEAVQRIRQAIRQQEAIATYGDFDADGVTSTSLMVRTLRAFGADVMPYIPHRVDEGYGLNNGALDFLHEQGVKLVITVDCGIRAVTEVEHGQRLGLDIIITDHHSIGPKLPTADIIVNPRQSDCTYGQMRGDNFRAFAGVGVAYKLAQGLLRAEAEDPVATHPVTLQEDDLLDVVAIGTVADIMPLRGENRSLVRRGLEQLRKNPRPGIQALAKKAKTETKQIDATAIGFRLAPRLNAAGRLGSAITAYDLLMAEDATTAQALTDDLDAMNKRRQNLTLEATQWALAQLGDNPPDTVILIGRENLNPGIVGLIASRLKENYYRPAMVVELGEEWARGSARSVPEFHITDALDKCSDLLLRYGGHAMAAGFTVHKDNLPKLRRRLNDIAAEQLRGVELVRKLPIDAIVRFDELDYALLNKLKSLEPTGAENPAPVLATGDLIVRNYRPVGRDNSHLKLNLTDGTTAFDAIGFGLGHFAKAMPTHVDIAFQLDENVWMGRRSLQLLIKDIKPAGQGIPRQDSEDLSDSPLFSTL